MQYEVVLTGLMLKKHVIIHSYLDDYATPVHQFTYCIEFKSYFNQYKSNIVSFIDTDEDDEDCMEMLTTFSQHELEESDKGVLFVTDLITFTFKTEEEALYFKLKYGDNDE